ncbi:MAG TPA: protease modulator HflC [Ruminiclostridium sp.]|jgi:membrane protease subunit HflC|nr:protease modulator HflC [Clostridiaceae bacterium]HAA24991.1 protease modulator HflC [Ruminiclostridium sp.]
MEQKFEGINKSKIIDLDKEKTKKVVKNILYIIAGIILFLILFNSFTFTVDEREQVIVTQFDRIVRAVVDDKSDPSYDILKQDERFKNIRLEERKGLCFKLPIIQKTISYTNKLLTYDTDPEEVFTLDKKTIVLDNFAEWQIVNPILFMQNLGSISLAHQRIDEFIYSRLREEIGRIDASKLVTDKDYVSEMLIRVRDFVNEQLEAQGIRIVDVKIKRTEYPEATYQNIFEQMRSERQAVATEYRSEGLKEAQRIRSEAEKEATIIEAQAYEQAQKIRGEGDAEALKIYAEAYNRDPEFYQFWKTLQTYEEVIDEDTMIIISPDSEFAKYIYGKD